MKMISLAAVFALLFSTAAFAGTGKKQDPKKKESTQQVIKPAQAPAAQQTKPVQTTAQQTTTASKGTATPAKPSAMRPHATSKRNATPATGPKKSSAAGTAHFGRDYMHKSHKKHHHGKKNSGSL